MGLSDEIEIYHKVTRLMLSLKLQPKMLGFDYIRSAVIYYLEHKEMLVGITTELYPMLAKKYNTNAASIERGIRKTIENAYASGGFLGLNEYYGAIIYTNKLKFSNSEIISILVEIIRLDSLKREVCEKLAS